jgi:phage-related tail fiber protein
MATRKTLYMDANGDYVESSGMFETSDYVNASSGVGDEGKPVVLNANGQIDSSMVAFDGLDWKQGARVATTAAINLASPGAIIDGVTMSSGDRVVVKEGSTVNSGSSSIDNGIYIWNGAASAMTRSTDADEDFKVTGNLIVAVSEGTANADIVFKIVTNDPIVVGTNAIEFEPVPFNIEATNDGTFNFDTVGSGDITVDLGDRESDGSSADYGNRI